MSSSGQEREEGEIEEGEIPGEWRNEGPMSSNPCEQDVSSPNASRYRTNNWNKQSSIPYTVHSNPYGVYTDLLMPSLEERGGDDRKRGRREREKDAAVGRKDAVRERRARGDADEHLKSGKSGEEREREKLLEAVRSLTRHVGVQDAMKSLDPVCRDLKSAIKKLDKALQITKKCQNLNSVEESPEITRDAHRIFSGLRAVHAVSGTGVGRSQNLIPAKEVMRTAMNYRHILFNPAQKKELEHWVRNSQLYLMDDRPGSKEKDDKKGRGKRIRENSVQGMQTPGGSDKKLTGKSGDLKNPEIKSSEIVKEFEDRMEKLDPGAVENGMGSEGSGEEAARKVKDKVEAAGKLPKSSGDEQKLDKRKAEGKDQVSEGKIKISFMKRGEIGGEVQGKCERTGHFVFSAEREKDREGRGGRARKKAKKMSTEMDAKQGNEGEAACGSDVSMANKLDCGRNMECALNGRTNPSSPVSEKCGREKDKIESDSGEQDMPIVEQKPLHKWKQSRDKQPDCNGDLEIDNVQRNVLGGVRPDQGTVAENGNEPAGPDVKSMSHHSGDEMDLDTDQGRMPGGNYEVSCGEAARKLPVEPDCEIGTGTVESRSFGEEVGSNPAHATTAPPSRSSNADVSFQESHSGSNQTVQDIKQSPSLTQDWPSPVSKNGKQLGEGVVGYQATATAVAAPLRLSSADNVAMNSEDVAEGICEGGGLEIPEKVGECLRNGKLCLVLDLDHSLLNSCKFSECSTENEELLEGYLKQEEEREFNDRELFKLNKIGMWTKLRPGLRSFLRKAQEHFELWIYTNGSRNLANTTGTADIPPFYFLQKVETNTDKIPDACTVRVSRAYADNMMSLIDPEGALFGDRVIAQENDGDQQLPAPKRLTDGLEGRESVVLIVDDSTAVWPSDSQNLFAVERYLYFPISRQKFGMPGLSLLEARKDEIPERGMLMITLNILLKVHSKVMAALKNAPPFIATPSGMPHWDVRRITSLERERVLAGVVLVFSRVIPLEQKPETHPLWRLAEQFGAQCVSKCTDETTHVVATMSGTEKVYWAKMHNRHVVTPNWLECCCTLWQRATEERFSVP